MKRPSVRIAARNLRMSRCSVDSGVRAISSLLRHNKFTARYIKERGEGSRAIGICDARNYLRLYTRGVRESMTISPRPV